MKKNKLSVGIITYHETYSYGANLQCLGLQLYLQNCGYKAEVIDYSTNAYLELRSKNRVKSLIQRGLKFIKNPTGFIKAKCNAADIAKKALSFRKELDDRNKKFKEFQKKYYHLSTNRFEMYSEIKENCPVYDAYICGSDQIWNPGFCDMDDNYFLTFAPKGKRIAYAPSFGVKTVPAYMKKEYRKRLNGIDVLSVREKTGAEIVKDITEKDIPVVIDPTFLINKEKWIEISKDSKLDLPKEYILTYFIGIDDYIQKFLDDVNSAFPEYKIINLVFDQSSYGPCDFIKLISEAKFVFTNSFHGLAFCINLNIPFAVGKTLKDYGVGSAFSRMEDLLESLDLAYRIYDSNKHLDNSWLDLDFSESNLKRRALVEKSEDYLRKALLHVK